ncbi:HD domain-containing protein [Granulicella sp. dw_53]|uniref:HD domain-containing protein n=1 Tax=Granulicella sp. dw_53 TaxID=2719792 RepID=UPI001BD26A42|nr:HD domain-containing protein [Granulicella sp. dw_53]
MPSDRFTPHEELARVLLPANGDFDDGSHDLSHLTRVWKNARTIHAEEGGDLELIAAAVLLHDCVQIAKDSPERANASRLAAQKARQLLASLGWVSDRIDTVAEAIESHSFSAGLQPASLEGRILQDADRLDAIGFTGIARCFYTAGRMGSSLYHPLDPHGETRPLNDSAFALDHFPKKLLRLSNGFQTETGRRLAHERERALQAFYDGMLSEISE